jgi:hypothetical protein
MCRVLASALKVQWKKIFFRAVFLISALAVLWAIDQIRYERDPKAFMPTDSWNDINRTFRLLKNILMLADYEQSLGELLILGEFAHESPEFDYINTIIKKWDKDHPIFTSYVNIIISCDFESGELYYGFSNAETLKRREKKRNDLIQSGEYYKNTKGDPYDGGDTILRRYGTLKSEDLSRLRERYP